MDDYSLHCDRLLFINFISRLCSIKVFLCVIFFVIFFMLTSFSNLSPSSPSGTLSFFLFFLFFWMFDPILYILYASMSLSTVPWLLRHLWKVHLERTTRDNDADTALCIDAKPLAQSLFDVELDVAIVGSYVVATGS